MNFKVGDVLKLRSGSPRMTVESVDAEARTVTCIWFGAGTHRRSFPEDALFKVAAEGTKK
jgi:uncharacterized protein YodC (DUF2158 family)